MKKKRISAVISAVFISYLCAVPLTESFAVTGTQRSVTTAEQSKVNERNSKTTAVDEDEEEETTEKKTQKITDEDDTPSAEINTESVTEEEESEFVDNTDSESFTSWKEAYYAKLSNFKKTKAYDSELSAWDLYDIDDDEIPELFISPTSTARTGVYVYTFSDNRLISLSFPERSGSSDTAGSWGTVSLIPEKNLLLSYSLNDCTEKEYYYRFSGKMFNSDAFFSNSKLDGEYYFNSSKVTEDNYNAEHEDYEELNKVCVGRKFQFSELAVSFQSYTLSSVPQETEPPVSEEITRTETEENNSALKNNLPRILAAGALIAALVAVLVPFLRNKKKHDDKSAK